MYYGVCYRFVDDYGDEVFPYQMEHETYMARYYYYKGVMI